MKTFPCIPKPSPRFTRRLLPASIFVFFVIFVVQCPAPARDRRTTATVEAAAERNKSLQTDLEWTFGGKAQQGWRIYVPLIGRTIGAEAEADSSDFARAVADWQAREGIAPSGALDEPTLMRMVQFWQERRPVKNPTEAAAETLTTIDRGCLYDPTRDPELCKVERETYAAYRRMVAAAATDLKLKRTETGEPSSDESFFKIISAFRPQAYQDKLRQQSPGSGRAGLARVSPHLTGRALDLYVGGDPVSTKDDNRLFQTGTPAYRWLVKNAHRFGFYPYFYEPWHWEYRTASR